MALVVLDAFLSAQLRARPDDLDGIDLRWAGTSLDELRDVLPRCLPAIQLLSLDALGNDPHAALRELQALGESEVMIVLHRFARPAVLRALEDEGFRLLAAPVSVRGLRSRMLDLLVHLSPGRTATAAERAPTTLPPTTLRSEPALGEEGSDAASRVVSLRPSGPTRAYTDEQLGKLMEAGTKMPSGCANHVAAALHVLAALEEHARRCANDEDDDAVLHRALANDTAKARGILEMAMDALVRREGLDL